MEYDFIKDKFHRDSLKNDIILLNPLKNPLKNGNENSKNSRILFELKNSTKNNEEEKNFVEINKCIKTKKNQKSQINNKLELLEKFELGIPQSKITKNVKSVLEMVFFFYTK